MNLLLQVCLYGGRCQKAFTVKYIMQNDDSISRLSNQGLPFKTYFRSSFVGRNEQLQLRESSSPRPFIATTDIPISDSDVFSGINESLSAMVCNTDTAITNTLKTITSSLQLASKGVNHTIDVSLDNIKLSLTSIFKGVSVVDGLRHVIITVEGFLTQGATFLVYAYTSIKDILPPELQNMLNSSQDNFLRPVGTAFQQVSPMSLLCTFIPIFAWLTVPHVLL